jgi:uncharacterized protein
MDSPTQTRILATEQTMRINACLSSLLDIVPAILAAFVATDDGFEVTQIMSGQEFEPARLAAMSSSISALSHAIVGECELGAARNLHIEATGGKILLLAIQSKPPMSLTVLAKANVTLGQLLVQSRECVTQIELVFS